MPKHIHAELMMQYAQDALTTDKPWELWEFKLDRLNVSGAWLTLSENPRWQHNALYRRKQKTININGFEVPKPVRDRLEYGTIYHMPVVDSNTVIWSTTWINHELDLLRLNRGIIHLTEEAAILHTKALLSFTLKEPTKDETN